MSNGNSEEMSIEEMKKKIRESIKSLKEKKGDEMEEINDEIFNAEDKMMALGRTVGVLKYFLKGWSNGEKATIINLAKTVSMQSRADKEFL